MNILRLRWIVVICMACRHPHIRSGMLADMPVACLTLELAIEHAQSLKDRRQVVRSLKDTLRRGFNVSIAELDEALVWNRATIGIAAISGSRSYLDGQLREVEDAAARLCVGLGAVILDSMVEVIDEL